MYKYIGGQLALVLAWYNAPKYGAPGENWIHFCRNL